MPAPLNTQSPEKRILDANTVNNETWFTRENNAWIYLNNYQFNGQPMVNHTWTSPSGNVFVFDPAGSDITMDGNAGGTLNATQRIIFFRYLPRFVGECLRNYNQTYSF